MADAATADADADVVRDPDANPDSASSNDPSSSRIHSPTMGRNATQVRQECKYLVLLSLVLMSRGLTTAINTPQPSLESSK